MRSAAVLAAAGLALAASANAGLLVSDLGSTAPTTAGQVDFYRPDTSTTNNQAVRNRNTSGDGFVALGQVFTASSTYTLDKLAIAITNGHATPVVPDTAGDAMFVSIWSYSGGVFGAAPLTTATGGTFPAGSAGGEFLEFDLTGANEITLTSGQQYAFQIGFTTLGDSDDPSFRILKTDGNAGAYPGGQVARFEGNGFTVTDFAALDPSTSNTTDQNADMYFVTYSVPEPTSMAVLALGSMAMLRRRRA